MWKLTGLEKQSQRLDGLVIDPAFNILTAAIHHDNAGLTKLFEVMRNSRRSDVQLFSYLPDVPPGLFDRGSSGSRRAEQKEPKEDGKPMRIA